jgi:hypothetical protein
MQYLRRGPCFERLCRRPRLSEYDIEVKVNQSHNTSMKGKGERIYSSYSLMTLALDVGEWSASRRGRSLPRGKDPRFPLNRRLGGPQRRSGERG